MVLLSLTSASDARAGILAGGASEVTQVMNKVELIMQTKKIIDQVRQTKQTLQLLKNNFQRLNPASWGQFAGTLNLLADSVKQGERTAFSLARADEEYERRFALASGTRERPARFSQAYQGWWTKNRASVRGLLAKVGMKASDFRNQQAGPGRRGGVPFHRGIELPEEEVEEPIGFVARGDEEPVEGPGEGFFS